MSWQVQEGFDVRCIRELYTILADIVLISSRLQTKEEGESLPSVKQTTLVLPVGAPTPFIGFGLGGSKGRHHCAEKMIRKFLNFKTVRGDSN